MCKILAYLIAVTAMVLSGCVGTTLEGGRMTSDKLIRDEYMPRALEGDPEAQYRVGLSYCCAPRSDAELFYDNREATRFLCSAARQNHAEAALQLGNFHSGQRVRGVRWIRRVVNLIRGDNLKNTTIAYYWYNQSLENGITDARQAMEDLGRQDISQYSDPVSTPCTVYEVYGSEPGKINE